MSINFNKEDDLLSHMHLKAVRSQANTAHRKYSKQEGRSFEYSGDLPYEKRLLLLVDRDLELQKWQDFLEPAMKTLTKKQRKAIEEVYFFNGLGRSQDKIANELGISRDSLKDRLSGAKKKIKNYLQKNELEFVLNMSLRESLLKKLFSSSNSSEKKKSTKKRPNEPVCAPVRHWSKENGEKVVQPTKSNPRPFGEQRLRAGINTQEIKEAIAKEYFEVIATYSSLRA